MACIVIVIAGLKAASAILLPALVAVFLAVVSYPPIAWLQSRGLPDWAAVLIVFVVVVAVFGGISVVVGHSIQDFTAKLDDYEQKLSGLTTSSLERLSSFGINISAKKIQRQLDPARLVGPFSAALKALGSMLSDALFVLLTVVFLLGEAAGLRHKLDAATGGSDAEIERWRGVLDDMHGYLKVKTGLSLLTGVAVGISVAVVGVDYPLLWGLLAFLLNYIPTLGSVIAAIPAVLLALLQLGWQQSLVLMIAFGLINLVVGNVMEPRMMGRRVGLSALVVFLSLVFWGWVWGPVGMVLSVPLTMLVKILLEGSEDLRWIAVLLGTGTAAHLDAPADPAPAS